jgi:hypothetical protein
VGLRGPSANVRPNHPQPSDDLVVSDTALAIFRRMRKLELHCDCPDGADPDTMCANCTELWRLNEKLTAIFHLPPWMAVYEDPRWYLSRSRQDAIDRFHARERAASKAKSKKEPRFKYKWQK